MSDEVPGTSPYEDLGVLAAQHIDVELAAGRTYEHHEIYTQQGLLSILLYPAEGSTQAVAMAGGALGGLLGGAGLYHRLGLALSVHGVAAASVGWRAPNHLDMCTHDMLAVLQVMARRGARRFITIGHSFGGAAAIRAAAAIPTELVPGTVTLATQSAGCEPAESLGDRRLLFIHGDNDRILPHMASEMVRMLAGTGELMILPGEDHLLAGATDQIVDRLLTWIPETFATDSAHDLPSRHE